LVGSLNRPGGNVTGFWGYTSLLGTKRLELMQQLFPANRSIAILVNPHNPNAHIDMPDLQDAARTLGQPISFVTASSETEIDAVFATLREQRISALLVNTDPFFLQRVPVIMVHSPNVGSSRYIQKDRVPECRSQHIDAALRLCAAQLYAKMSSADETPTLLG